jgi:hypothetical protein
LAEGKTINNFVNGAVTAASQDHVGTVRDRRLCQFARHGGPYRGRQLNLQPCLPQDGSSFANFALSLRRTPPGNRIVNEDAFFQFWILDQKPPFASRFPSLLKEGTMG